MGEDDSSYDDGMDDPEMIQLTELVKKMDVGEKKPEKGAMPPVEEIIDPTITDEIEDDPEADAQISSLLAEMQKLDKLGE